MTASRAREIVLAARPQGKPQLTDFRLEETEIPTPASGQLLLAAQHRSLDPYMRGRMDDRKSYAPAVAIGQVMSGESVAEVIESNHAGHARRPYPRSYGMANPCHLRWQRAPQT
jgi:hypothetical protein